MSLGFRRHYISAKALNNKEVNINIGEGGTTLRFILAYYCLTGQNKILDGLGNLKSRPIMPLIRGLEQLACLFQFENQNYYLPIKIVKGVNKDHSDVVHVDSQMSSQFVSSILLIAPYFHNGLKVSWSPEGVSEPYIHMTLQLMQQFGIQFSIHGNSVDIKSGTYSEQTYTVEADWSAAAFILSWIALQEKFLCFFPNLKRSGLQADEVVLNFLQAFGITAIQEENGLLVEKKSNENPKHIEFDFTNCPDLFPALAIFCAIQKVNATFKGLQHLEHKESNRLHIITNFLQLCKVTVLEILAGREMYFNMQTFQINKDITLDSHQDHRIAMAFSLLHKLTNVSISNSHVVSKSFPSYWEVFEDLRRGTS
ncbi:MAG: hypothetical protein IPM92_10365 [Saprospiraceae bacterium]|nr:hypothetical protein [Saprospiraceae bacterium]